MSCFKNDYGIDIKIAILPKKSQNLDLDIK